VLNYKPSKIVYYEGDNDIAKGFTTEMIISEIDSFINIVHSNLPATQIYIIPPKPSYARLHLWNKYLALHSKLRQLNIKYPFVFYIDIVKPMFEDNGILRKDIFVEDNLHLNEKGYQIWGKTIREALGFQ
jgi:lysophospholipase L1-like esterase